MYVCVCVYQLHRLHEVTVRCMCVCVYQLHRLHEVTVRCMSCMCDVHGCVCKWLQEGLTSSLTTRTPWRFAVLGRWYGLLLMGTPERGQTLLTNTPVSNCVYECSRPPLIPPLQCSSPPLECSRSLLKCSCPPLECSSPPLECSRSLLKCSCPPLECSIPPLECSRPLLECSRPPLECSRPPLECSRPLLECSRPPLKCSSPPLECSRPPLECSRPPLISVTVRFSSLSEIVASMTGGVAMETVSPLAGM